MKLYQVQQSHVIDLNNKGVAYLQAGQSREAMASLRMAASILREHFPAANNIDDNDDEDCTAPSATSTTSTSSSNTSATTPATSNTPSDEEFHLQKEETPSAMSTNDSNSTPTTTDITNNDMDVVEVEQEEEEVYEAVVPLIYSVPATSFDTTTINGSKISSTSFSSFNRALVASPLLQDAEIMSGVILYNMGLVNHLHGLRRGLSSFVDQAMRLYQTGLVIMQTCYNEGMDSDCDDDDNDNELQQEMHFLSTSLVLLALLNNSAQIYSHLVQREGLSYSLDCMRHVLGSTNPAGLNPLIRRLHQQRQQQAEQEESAITNDEYESYSFFYMNAVVYSLVDSLALAPAA